MKVGLLFFYILCTTCRGGATPKHTSHAAECGQSYVNFTSFQLSFLKIIHCQPRRQTQRECQRKLRVKSTKVGKENLIGFDLVASIPHVEVSTRPK